jgi:hypothetical protein
VRPYVVSHLNAKLQNWRSAGIYFFQEKSLNLDKMTGLLIKCNSFALSPNLVQQTGRYSPSLLVSCSVLVFQGCRPRWDGRGLLYVGKRKRTRISLQPPFMNNPGPTTFFFRVSQFV